MPAQPPQEGYVPAAGRRALTGAYDRAVALTMREGTFRTRLRAQVLADAEGELLEVVDLGCGTGTLAIALADERVRVTGVDGDPDILRQAQRKRGAEHVSWHRGGADALPHPEASVDRVVCSLVLHHLRPAARALALGEARRVLRPGGRLHVADWGRPGGPVMSLAFLGLRMLDGFANTADFARGELPALIAAAGFTNVSVRDRLRTGFGALELISATRPVTDSG